MLTYTILTTVPGLSVSPANCSAVLSAGRQAETWTAADAETMELETAAERAAIRDDPLARLEHGLDDKRRAKETRGRLLELRADAEAKYADDYAINKALRAKNRCAVKPLAAGVRRKDTGQQLPANPARSATADADAAMAAALQCQPRGSSLSCVIHAVRSRMLLDDLCMHRHGPNTPDTGDGRAKRKEEQRRDARRRELGLPDTVPLLPEIPEDAQAAALVTFGDDRAFDKARQV